MDQLELRLKVGDEGEDVDAVAALRTGRVGLEHPTDQGGPSSSKGFTLGGVELVVVGCGSFLSGVFSSSSGVVAVVQDGMLVGLGNVDEHSGEELKRVEELGFSIVGFRGRFRSRRGRAR